MGAIKAFTLWFPLSRLATLNGLPVDEHFGRVRGSDDLEQVAESRGVVRPEARAVPTGGAAPGFAALGGAGEWSFSEA